MDNRVIDILEASVEKWGVEEQTTMAIEEMGELIVAINHYRRGRIWIAALQEEIADVWITIHQMALMYGINEVQDIYKKKIKRLECSLK